MNGKDAAPAAAAAVARPQKSSIVSARNNALGMHTASSSTFTLCYLTCFLFIIISSGNSQPERTKPASPVKSSKAPPPASDDDALQPPKKKRYVIVYVRLCFLFFFACYPIRMLFSYALFFSKVLLRDDDGSDLEVHVPKKPVAAAAATIKPSAVPAPAPTAAAKQAPARTAAKPSTRAPSPLPEAATAVTKAPARTASKPSAPAPSPVPRAPSPPLEPAPAITKAKPAAAKKQKKSSETVCARISYCACHILC